jgi:hypothetical protein
VQLTLRNLLDDGRDRQEAVNEVLMTCAQTFGAEALGYAEWNLGIKLSMTRPAQTNDQYPLGWASGKE